MFAALRIFFFYYCAAVTQCYRISMDFILAAHSLRIFYTQSTLIVFLFCSYSSLSKVIYDSVYNVFMSLNIMILALMQNAKILIEKHFDGKF